MTHRVHLDGSADFAGWRAAARRLAEAGVAPHDVVWATSEGGDLFEGGAEPPVPAGDMALTLRVPRGFLELGVLIACHSDPARFDLLYRLLVRLQAERHLLEVSTDDDVFRANGMARVVRRDRHKMEAFVRFKEIPTEDGKVYLAWFEPEHHILELTAPFFAERFSSMRWSILTPEASAHWDRDRLVIGPGGVRADVPAEDALDDAWRTYYAHIFNPARLKIDAMKKEMPVRYWKNLPEAQAIPGLVRAASAREAQMIEAPADPGPRRAPAILRGLAERREAAAQAEAAEPGTLEALRREAAGCRRCPLWEPATQTVFGEGEPGADLVFVGEQPGDKEDLAGRPFIGPAGQLFDEALGKAGIERTRAYVTNAVKHFKFEPRGKRRIHQKPNTSEIDACRWWVEREVALLRPRLTVALGATAVRGLTGRDVPILRTRGSVIDSPFAGKVFVTVHPSFLLRLPDERAKQLEFGKFVDDLTQVKRLLDKAA